MGSRMAPNCWLVYNLILSSDLIDLEENSKNHDIISGFGFLWEVRKMQFCEDLVQGAVCKHTVRIQKGNPKYPWGNAENLNIMISDGLHIPSSDNEKQPIFGGSFG